MTPREGEIGPIYISTNPCGAGKNWLMEMMERYADGPVRAGKHFRLQVMEELSKEPESDPEEQFWRLYRRPRPKRGAVPFNFRPAQSLSMSSTRPSLTGPSPTLVHELEPVKLIIPAGLVENKPLEAGYLQKLMENNSQAERNRLLFGMWTEETPSPWAEKSAEDIADVMSDVIDQVNARARARERRRLQRIARREVQRQNESESALRPRARVYNIEKYSVNIVSDGRSINLDYHECDSSRYVWRREPRTIDIRLSHEQHPELIKLLSDSLNDHTSEPVTIRFDDQVITGLVMSRPVVEGYSREIWETFRIMELLPMSATVPRRPMRPRARVDEAPHQSQSQVNQSAEPENQQASALRPRARPVDLPFELPAGPRLELEPLAPLEPVTLPVSDIEFEPDPLRQAGQLVANDLKLDYLEIETDPICPLLPDVFKHR